MKINKRLFLTLALGAVLVGCESKKDKTTEQTEPTKVLIKTEAATVQTVEQTEEFTANIEPYKRTTSLPQFKACASTVFWLTWVTA